MTPQTVRLSSGTYRTRDGRALIRRVEPEARRAGYGDGWHLIVDDQYVQTYATKTDALNCYLLDAS